MDIETGVAWAGGFLAVGVLELIGAGFVVDAFGTGCDDAKVASIAGLAIFNIVLLSLVLLSNSKAKAELEVGAGLSWAGVLLAVGLLEALGATAVADADSLATKIASIAGLAMFNIALLSIGVGIAKRHITINR